MPDHAERRAAELIGIARARRLLADRPEADQRVELVGERHGDGDRVAVLLLRHRVGRRPSACSAARSRARSPAWCRRPRRSSGPSGPATPGTRRPCRRRDRPWRAAPRGAHPRAPHRRRRRAGRPAPRSRSTRSHWVPSLSWNVMPRSWLAISSSGRFRSWSQKNLASDSRARITFSLPATICLPPSLAIRFDTQQEPVGELAGLRVLQREALLVVLHRRGQAFGRHGEERLVERAHQHGRPFGEAGVLGQQALVLDQLELGRPWPPPRAPARRSSAARSEAGSSTLCVLSLRP